MAKSIRLNQARRQLATIWFMGGGALFLIVIVQAILGKYGDQVQEVFSWFVPTVFPTLSLMGGVMGATALQPRAANNFVDRFFLTLSVGLSLAYLLVLGLTILLQPFSPMSGVELYTMSNFYLAPMQALVVAAITVLFTSKRETQ